MPYCSYKKPDFSSYSLTAPECSSLLTALLLYLWPAPPPDRSYLLTALLLHFQPAAALTHYPIPPPIAPGAPLMALLLYS